MDNFEEIIRQSISLCNGYGQFLDEEYNRTYSWNVIQQIIILRKQTNNSKKIINFCNIYALHLAEVAKLNREYVELFNKFKAVNDGWNKFFEFTMKEKQDEN